MRFSHFLRTLVMRYVNHDFDYAMYVQFRVGWNGRGWNVLVWNMHTVMIENQIKENLQ